MQVGPWYALLLQPESLGVMLGCGIPIVAIICAFWYRAQKTRAECALKADMVARGMSADEIERVITAGTRRPHR